MSIIETQPGGIDLEIFADLEAAGRHAVTGQCDPETLQRIDVRAAQARQKLLDKVGVQEIGAHIIREMRDNR